MQRQRLYHSGGRVSYSVEEYRIGQFRLSYTVIRIERNFGEEVGIMEKGHTKVSSTE